MKDKIIERIKAIRKIMNQNDVDGYLIVSDDFHASEYVSDYFKVREYMSGFSGSAGTLLIMKEWAGLWTDGRYFLQAREQLKDTGIELMKMGEEGVPGLIDYLKEHMPKGGVLGFDGRTIRVSLFESLKDALGNKEIVLKEQLDFVGELWKDRPTFPKENVWFLDTSYTGKTIKEKLSSIREKLMAKKAHGMLIAALDDIAWIFNLRGSDILYNPVFLSYAYIGTDKVFLYRDKETLSKEAKTVLAKNGVEVRPYLQVYEDVRKLEGKRVIVDENAINITLRNSFSNKVTLINEKNHMLIAKAEKNETEQNNERKAHLLDGVAVTKLIYWLKERQKARTVSELRETDVCNKLETLRKEGEGYLGQSFAPIVATGKNGAVVHYEPVAGQDAFLEEDNFILMDTGGQYLFGTTDITRTVALGKITKEQKVHYTAVLKGHIRLAMAKFKYGCTGANLDYLARSPLWELGLDYNHGTGHGVGYLLNVHEGPNGIRLREADGSVGTKLEEGMITSDEPGLYFEGKYGIRIENLILCKKGRKTECGQFMEFETLTMVPYEREAILPEMLNKEELGWLNNYHKVVFDSIKPMLSKDEAKWLEKQTMPL